MDILGREKVYQGRLIDVEKIHVRLADGKERHYEMVNHADAVTLLPIDEKGMIYFVEQFRVGNGGHKMLELPAGVIDPNEMPIDAAHRELREETGFASKKLSLLTEYYMIVGYGDEFMHGYLAQDLYPAALEPDDDEDLTLVPIHVSEVYRMLFNNEFEDGKTIIILSLAIPHLIRRFPELHQALNS